jgi:antitoxin (DNA-binding transcriptional repressor) of toxin-antitoxin stability system
MTITINVPETAEQFSALLQQIQTGEEILLAQHGVAIARITPIAAATQPRIPGQDKGTVSIAADFNASLPETVINDFLNSSFPNS